MSKVKDANVGGSGAGKASKESNKWGEYFKGVGNELKDEMVREGKAIVNLPANIASKGFVGTFKDNIIPGATENIKMHGRNVKNFFKTLFNHPEWYGKYPNFISTNLNWGVRKEAVGWPMAVGHRVMIKLTVPQKDGNVSQAYKDAIQAIFIKVRGSNSGAFNYTAEDVAAYLECVRGMVGLHTSLVRDVHVLNNIDPYVARTPNGLLTMLGYDAAGIADLVDNKSTYVATLNQLKNSIEAAFPLPPDLAVLDRTKFISKALIEEGKGPKSSVYAYYLGYVSKAGVGTGNEGTILEINTYGTSMPARIAILEGLVNAAHDYVSLTYSNYDTFAKIAGDIMKAYGNKGFYSLDTCELTKRADVICDAYLLHQLQNTSTAQGIDGWSLMGNLPAFQARYYAKAKIEGDSTHTNKISTIYGFIDGSGDYIPIPVNTDKSEISGLEAISITRNIYTVKAASGTSFTFDTQFDVKVNDCHTDLVANIVSYHFKGDNSGFDRVGISSSGRSKFYLTRMTLWAQVDYSPCIQVWDDATNDGAFVPMLDIDTFALMTLNQIKNFNDAAVLSVYKTVNIDDQVNFRAVKR